MRKTVSIAALTAILAAPAFAKVTIQDLDATGDSFATFEEVRNAIPEMDKTDFNAIDANGDRRLSSVEVNTPEAQTTLTQHQMRSEKERPLFLLDPDGDGFMTYENMTSVHPSLTMNTFQEIDENGDQRLSYAEFYTIEAQTALAQCSEATFVDLTDLDGDGDRFLSLEELKQGYPRVTNADFRTIDLNKDNRISAVELLAPTAECLNKY